MTEPTGTDRPAPRNTRANATAMRSGSSRASPVGSASRTAGHRGLDERGDSVRTDPFLIFAVLQDRAERDVDRPLVELGASECRKRLRPVDRLRDTGRLVELEPAQRLDRGGDLPREHLRNLRCA